MPENSYLSQVHGVLPRLLALFDSDSTSASYGMGDRYYWAWGLIDFGNATFQGAAHGMARLWKHELWPYDTSKAHFIARIDAMFMAAKALSRRDGSLEEAFPNEGSYCVTALVGFDLLCCIELLNPDIDEHTRKRWLDVIRPMTGYLIRSDETHALISNHLATAAAALARWHAISGDVDAESKAAVLLDRILQHQSAEGWFKEYEGADPGYQSLCTYYLADLHGIRPDWKLLEPLRRSIQFLWHFAHPDGSFGGVYGSRCTRFYYPAGLEALAAAIPEAAALASFMATSIAQELVVTLGVMDEPNLIPMFNAYCWAATYDRKPAASAPPLPCAALHNRIDFPDAGIVVDGGPRHYSIISTHKGGVVMHFRDRTLVVHDTGTIVRNSKGEPGSSQAYAPENAVEWNGDVLTIHAAVSPMPKRLTKPVNLILLRLLCITLFHIPAIREWTKRQLVRMLITNRKPWPAGITREIQLGVELTIHDTLKAPSGFTLAQAHQPFIAIHMASQGYWQSQDEQQP